jgi:hypothetical protein
MGSLSNLGRRDPVLMAVIGPPGLGRHKRVIVSYNMAEGAMVWPSPSGHDIRERTAAKRMISLTICKPACNENLKTRVG